MLRILLLLLIGLFAAASALRVIGGVVAFVIDMKKGGAHAPEILGTLTGALVITLGLGWVWRKVYFSKPRPADLPPR